MVVATFEQTNGERNNYHCPYVHIYIYKFTIIRELRIRDAEYMMIDGVDETKITRKKTSSGKKMSNNLMLILPNYINIDRISV